jgi:hypothetical protein
MHDSSVRGGGNKRTSQNATQTTSDGHRRVSVQPSRFDTMLLRTVGWGTAAGARIGRGGIHGTDAEQSGADRGPACGCGPGASPGRCGPHDPILPAPRCSQSSTGYGSSRQCRRARASGPRSVLSLTPKVLPQKVEEPPAPAAPEVAATVPAPEPPKTEAAPEPQIEAHGSGSRRGLPAPAKHAAEFEIELGTAPSMAALHSRLVERESQFRPSVRRA